MFAKDEQASIQQVTVEPLTADAFKPYGEILRPLTREPDWQGTGGGTECWRMPFAVDGEVEIATLRSFYQRHRFERLERHLNVTQTFVPLGTNPCAVAFGSEGDARGPAPGTVRAFLLDGTSSYLMHRGTWHSLDRYPRNQEPVDFLIITERETTEEITSGVPPSEWQRTTDVNYRLEHGVVFELVFPAA